MFKHCNEIKTLTVLDSFSRNELIAFALIQNQNLAQMNLNSSLIRTILMDLDCAHFTSVEDKTKPVKCQCIATLLTKCYKTHYNSNCIHATQVTKEFII